MVEKIKWKMENDKGMLGFECRSLAKKKKTLLELHSHINLPLKM
jgi:hypothetical protein